MAEIIRAQVQAATGVYEVLAVTSKGLVRVTDASVLDRLLAGNALKAATVFGSVFLSAECNKRKKYLWGEPPT